MKNIHVLPTDKPSVLKQNNITKKISLVNKGIDLTAYTPINIYITSDEEIKEGDWFMSDFNSFPLHNIKELFEREGALGWKQKDLKNNLKIILTTDQDLIKDGIQAIDDEFLEWFVKNPSCEEVEVEDYGNIYNFRYLILIPKEEPKQETLKEVELAILFHNTYEKLAPSFGYETREDTKSFDITTPNGKLMIAVCKEIMKWQQERMYSEEDMKKAFEDGKEDIDYSEVFGFVSKLTTEEWFEQFKNK